jgi:hypothetical protein
MVTRIALRLCAAVVIVYLGLALLFNVLNAWREASTSAIKFDSAAWKTERGAERRMQRARMLGNLHAKHLKTGMSRKEVIILLGSPDIDKRDELSYFWGAEYDENGGGMLRFNLGKKSKVKDIQLIRWCAD